MHIEIPFGSKKLQCTLPSGSVALRIKEPEKRLTPELFRQKIAQVADLASFDYSRTCIVLADKTRVCGYPVYLPVLIEILKTHGLEDSNLRCIIAYGTHPRQSDQECLQSLGDVYSHHTFIHHDCSDTSRFLDLGETTRGVPIRIRKDIYQASCLITMGPICHHYFAGYGGGRKLIFPGCGEKKAIYANHGLYLNRDHGQLSATCQPGVLRNNPLAEDLFEIEDHKTADISIHGLMDSHGNLCDIVAGSGRKSYITACRLHGTLCESSSPTHPFVVASCGGFPKDINYIQTHKAIHNASMFVEDGGTLLLFSQCRDGVGSQTFLPWFEMGGFHQAFERLCHSYEGNGGTALATMTKTSRIRIIMVTDLDDHVCNLIDVQKWSIDKALEYIKKRSEPLCYIANASLLVRKTVPLSL